MRPLYLKINQFRNQRNDDKVNNIVVSDNIKIENMIYEIRGKQVMLDSDLAMLYGCKNGTKSLNLAVKRHINRFPERFMFQLTKEEYSSIYSRFQIETLNKQKNILLLLIET